MTSIAFRRSYPSWCCPYCGEAVGWLGRVWAWLFGTQFHNCSRSNVQPPPPRGVNVKQIRDLLWPGLRQEAGHIGEDPFHPVAEFDIWVEAGDQRLVLWALWKDGSERKATIAREELQGDTSSIIAAYRKALREISPEYAFLDDAVVAYDDAGWRA